MPASTIDVREKLNLIRESKAAYEKSLQDVENAELALRSAQFDLDTATATMQEAKAAFDIVFNNVLDELETAVDKPDVIPLRRSNRVN